MSNRIENIIIVGGGTAGWLAACYLNRALNHGQANCTITLIEAEDIDTIGVGEATLPTLRRTMSFLGFDEAEWMVQCQATFKLGLKFINWATRDHTFWFPFQSLSRRTQQMVHANLWLKDFLQGDPLPYSQLHENAHLSQAKRSPQSSDYPPYQGAVNYAYHVDAGLLATYLKQKAKAAGVIHRLDKVVEIKLTEQGFIDHLVTTEHGGKQPIYILTVVAFGAC